MFLAYNCGAGEGREVRTTIGESQWWWRGGKKIVGIEGVMASGAEVQRQSNKSFIECQPQPLFPWL